MKNQTYVTRRGNTATNATSWTRNRNTIRHTPKSLGSVSSAVIVGLLVLIVGLFYVSQSAQVTSFDYQSSDMEKQIAELEEKKEDLAVEKARINSIASTEGSEVAVSMENATPSGYASE